ncbi:MAG TPA: hypothetical protein VII92_12890 [Anaerolineae bacterium]
MNLDPTFVLHVIEAIALGLAVAVILRALRRFAAVRRVRQLAEQIAIGVESQSSQAPSRSWRCGIG